MIDLPTGPEVIGAVAGSAMEVGKKNHPRTVERQRFNDRLAVGLIKSVRDLAPVSFTIFPHVTFTGSSLPRSGKQRRTSGNRENEWHDAVLR
jgi:hypothetical protein